MDKSCNNAALVLADLVCKYCVAEIWLGVPQPFITHCIDLIIFVTCNIYPVAFNRKKEKKDVYILICLSYVFVCYINIITFSCPIFPITLCLAVSAPIGEECLVKTQLML